MAAFLLFIGMERIFVQDKETRLLGFLHPREADYKKVEAMAAFLGLCQNSSVGPFCAMAMSPYTPSVLLAGIFWKPIMPAGAWYAGELAGPWVG